MTTDTEVLTVPDGRAAWIAPYPGRCVTEGGDGLVRLAAPVRAAQEPADAE